MLWMLLQGENRPPAVARRAWRSRARGGVRLLSVLALALTFVTAVLLNSAPEGQGCHGGCWASPVSERDVTPEPLGSSVPVAVPAHALSLLRVTIDPGGHSAHHQTYPSARVIYVASGTVQFTVSSDNVQVLTANGATPTATLEPEGGSTYTLAAGDRVIQDETSQYDFTNVGDEPALLWIADLTPGSAGTPVADH